MAFPPDFIRAAPEARTGGENLKRHAHFFGNEPPFGSAQSPSSFRPAPLGDGGRCGLMGADRASAGTLVMPAKRSASRNPGLQWTIAPVYCPLGGNVLLREWRFSDTLFVEDQERRSVYRELQLG